MQALSAQAIQGGAFAYLPLYQVSYMPSHKAQAHIARVVYGIDAPNVILAEHSALFQRLPRESREKKPRIFFERPLAHALATGEVRIVQRSGRTSLELALQEVKDDKDPAIDLSIVSPYALARSHTIRNVKSDSPGWQDIYTTDAESSNWSFHCQPPQS